MIQIDLKTLDKSFTYSEFRTFVSEALANNIAALEIDESYLSYAQLNETRLNRLDKTLKVGEEAAAYLQQLKKDYLWLVISESWCGDAAQIVPMINKMAESSDRIDLKLVFRDKNLDLMDQFLTNGGRAIPKLIIVDKETMQVVADWGPRPVLAQKLVEDYKAAHGTVDEQGKIELQKWYTKDKGKEVESEIIALMKSI
ncbi:MULTISPECIES: thioredoxin family protein [Myroides]|uniref:Thioredoxin family protein n=1 Tax=Myroides albus TaxID=2562892 RepID=A0A6I3LF77_9FLAO|nr:MULTISPECIES: thioredoxin family protein [Myroides]MTG96863.1 thioredoxin family protein [Myroides albus]MVX36513.1 thioredoxin family protein [Myroides sp. LoEW2-1]UVD78387.1 thioredoxin family protein [Myroides albus]